MSITQNDKYSYQEVSDQLGFDDLQVDGKRNIYQDTYETTKDLRIASPETVKRYIFNNCKNMTLKEVIGCRFAGQRFVEQFGDVKVKDFFVDETMSFEYEKSSGVTNPERDPKDQFSYNYYRMITDGNRALANNFFMDKKLNKKMIKDFAKMGVDAIADYEDIKGGFEYPVIVINPKDSLKKTGHRQIGY